MTGNQAAMMIREYELDGTRYGVYLNPNGDQTHVVLSCPTPQPGPVGGHIKALYDRIEKLEAEVSDLKTRLSWHLGAP